MLYSAELPDKFGVLSEQPVLDFLFSLCRLPDSSWDFDHALRLGLLHIILLNIHSSLVKLVIERPSNSGAEDLPSPPDQ